jgi:hypothetical protein
MRAPRSRGRQRMVPLCSAGRTAYRGREPPQRCRPQHDRPSRGSGKSARAATFFIHKGAPQALVGCLESMSASIEAPAAVDALLTRVSASPRAVLRIRHVRLRSLVQARQRAPVSAPAMSRRRSRPRPSAARALAFAVAGSQGSPPHGRLAPRPRFPLPFPQMPASGLCKPASNGHAERERTHRRDRERGSRARRASAPQQESECVNVSRSPAEPVEAWHGFSCQWRKAERRGETWNERRRLRLYRPRNALELLYL